MISRDNLRAAFNSVDNDGSGSIELSELSTLCGKVDLPNVDHAAVQDLFKEMDTNHDGKISFEEFVAWYRLGRKSDLKDYLKFNLKVIEQFDTHFTKKYKACEHSSQPGRQHLIDIEIRDGEPSDTGNSMALFNVCSRNQQGDLNRFRNACPKLNMGPEGQQSFSYISLKASNVEGLRNTIETFFDITMEMLVEKDPSLEFVIENMKYQVGTDGDYVVLGFQGEGNPMLEQFLQMGFQAGQFTYNTEPELVLQFNSDQTLESFRKADDLMAMTDATRIHLGLSYALKSRAEFLQLAQGIMQGDSDDDTQFNALKLMKEFKMRLRTNPSNDHGSLHENVKNGVAALKEFNHPMFSSFVSGYEDAMVNQKKNWAEVLQCMRENKDSEYVKSTRDAMNDFPFVKDFVLGVRDNGLYEMRMVAACNHNQLTCEFKGRGLKECFSDLWDIMWE